MDLGVGSGILSIGAALLGCKEVVAVDVDPEALAVAKENWTAFELESQDCGVPLHLLECNLEELRLASDCFYCGETLLLENKKVDVVIMNPPFGTKKKGIDVVFLRKALEISPIVYSLHKSSTRQFIMRKAKEFGAKADVIAELKYDLGKTYKCHKKDSVDIEVDFIRFVRTNKK